MVLINGSVSADKTAIRKLGQMTSYRQIDRFKVAKQKGRSIIKIAALTNSLENSSDKYTKK